MLESLGKRILVVGDSGSGKSTVGAEIARRCGLEPVELDALYWGPEWTPVDGEVFRERVRAAVGAESWVIVGNYFPRVRDLSWPPADTIVWLDLSMRITIPRLLRRTWHRWRSGEESWGGRESFWVQFKLWDPEASLIGYTLKTHRRRRRQFLSAMHDPSLAGVRFEQLRSRAEVERFLERKGCS